MFQDNLANWDITTMAVPAIQDLGQICWVIHLGIHLGLPAGLLAFRGVGSQMEGFWGSLRCP